MELMEEAMQDMVFGRWRMALPEKQKHRHRDKK